MSQLSAGAHERALRVFIAEDERPARLGLRALLEAQPGIEITGEYETGPATLDALRKERPDLLFLDIQMPGMSGFEVLEQLSPERWPHVVFVTAYDEYAVQAFELNALDYLLKPFDEARLEKTLDRARTLLGGEPNKTDREGMATDRDADIHDREETAAADRGGSLRQPRLARFLEHREQSASPSGSVTRIVVRETGRIRFVPVKAIRWIAGAGNLAELHLESEVVLHRETLQSLEERLDPRDFLRIHRSTIVRMQVVEELRPLRRGDHEVILDDGTILKLSRSRLQSLRDRL